MRHVLYSLAGVLLALTSAVSTVRATSVSQTVVITLPPMNVQGAGIWGASDSQLVYVLPSPLIHAPGCASCGHPYTDFTNQIYAIALQSKNGKLTPTGPRRVFSGPTGYTVGFNSVAGNWVVFELYNSPESGGPWTIIALNTVTRRSVLLDSRDKEGVPSLSPTPRTDGKTVVWQTWTVVNSVATSVIRSYNLQTGKRRLVAQGGTIRGWSYFQASVSGDRVTFTKRFPATQQAQIMLANLKTGQLKAITPAGKANSDPWISGSLLVWRIGWSFSHTKAIAVRNIQSGTQRILPADNAQYPQALLSRYVVFSTGYSRADTRIQVYDDLTHMVRTLVGPYTWSNNRYPGSEFAVGGHAVSYQLSSGCAAVTKGCVGQVVVQVFP